MILCARAASSPPEPPHIKATPTAHLTKYSAGRGQLVKMLQSHASTQGEIEHGRTCGACCRPSPAQSQHASKAQPTRVDPGLLGPSTRVARAPNHPLSTPLARCVSHVSRSPTTAAASPYHRFSASQCAASTSCQAQHTDRVLHSHKSMILSSLPDAYTGAWAGQCVMCCRREGGSHKKRCPRELPTSPASVSAPQVTHTRILSCSRPVPPPAHSPHSPLQGAC